MIRRASSWTDSLVAPRRSGSKNPEPERNVYNTVVFVASVAVAGTSFAQTSSKDRAAAAWVAAYTKVGGRASLGTGPDGRTELAIQKRKGQRPLVSLKGFGAAPGVRAVILQGYEVSDEDVETVAGWTGVERVEVVDGIKVTDAGAKAVARLPVLRSVVLADTAVTGKGLAAFCKHPTLAHLAHSNTVLPGQVKTLDLRELAKLETITLAGEGISRISLTGLPRLREVADFPHSLEVADLSGLGRVRELDFSHTRLKSLSLTDAPKLQFLNLRHTEVPRDTVDALRKNWPEVRIQR